MADMIYRRLGRSGLQVSVLSFGSWVSFGPQIDVGKAVDVTVQRRFLGFLPVSTATVRDVVNADVYIVSGRSGDGPRSRGGTMALQLTARDGSVWRWRRFGPAFGTQPNDVAARIQELIDDRDKQSFSAWWMPWVVNIGAVPFVLVVGAIWGSVLLRAFGFLKPDPAPAPKQS